MCCSDTFPLSAETRTVGEPKAALIDGLLASHSVSVYISLIMTERRVVTPDVSPKWCLDFTLIYVCFVFFELPLSLHGPHDHASPSSSHRPVFSILHQIYEKRRQRLRRYFSQQWLEGHIQKGADVADCR